MYIHYIYMYIIYIVADLAGYMRVHPSSGMSAQTLITHFGQVIATYPLDNSADLLKLGELETRLLHFKDFLGWKSWLWLQTLGRNFENKSNLAGAHPSTARLLQTSGLLTRRVKTAHRGLFKEDFFRSLRIHLVFLQETYPERGNIVSTQMKTNKAMSNRFDRCLQSCTLHVCAFCKLVNWVTSIPRSKKDI